MNAGDESIRPDVILRLVGFEGVAHGSALAGDVANHVPLQVIEAKREVYRRFEVQEYIVWRVAERAVDWFVLRNGYYWPLRPGADGVLRSEVFPGLWLDAAALVSGDSARVFAVAQLGHASPEHAAFVAELRRRAGHPA